MYIGTFGRFGLCCVAGSGPLGVPVGVEAGAADWDAMAVANVTAGRVRPNISQESGARLTVSVLASQCWATCSGSGCNLSEADSGSSSLLDWIAFMRASTWVLKTTSGVSLVLEGREEETVVGLAIVDCFDATDMVLGSLLTDGLRLSVASRPPYPRL